MPVSQLTIFDKREIIIGLSGIRMLLLLHIAINSNKQRKKKKKLNCINCHEKSI